MAENQTPSPEQSPAPSSPTLERIAPQPEPPTLPTATAWESIGWDYGHFRIKGGTAIFEAVLFNCASPRQQKVKLARVEATSNGIREVSRYVERDTVLEFFDREALALFRESLGILSEEAGS